MAPSPTPAVPYPILILPAVERIPLATYRKLEEYVRKGGILIATQHAPSLAPGLMEAADTPKMAETSRALFQIAGAPGHLVADLSTLPAVLHAALPADVATAPEIGFVHRKLGFADVYFLANTSNHPVHSPAVFRVRGLAAASWNPITGEVGQRRRHAHRSGSRALRIARAGLLQRARAQPSRRHRPRPAPVELNGKMDHRLRRRIAARRHQHPALLDRGRSPQIFLRPGHL